MHVQPKEEKEIPRKIGGNPASANPTTNFPVSSLCVCWTWNSRKKWPLIIVMKFKIEWRFFGNFQRGKFTRQRQQPQNSIILVATTELYFSTVVVVKT